MFDKRTNPTRFAGAPLKRGLKAPFLKGVPAQPAGGCRGGIGRKGFERLRFFALGGTRTVEVFGIFFVPGEVGCLAREEVNLK
jgi:hypothetical protein